MAETQMQQVSSNESEDPHSLSDVLDQVLQSTGKTDVKVGNVLDAFNSRSYGPLLLVPSLLALGPTGAIPGMSIAMGSLIILIAAQMLFQKGRPWVPERIRKFSFSRDRLESGIETSRPYVHWVEQWIKPRLAFLATRPWGYAIPLVCIFLALAMFPLALVPFGVAPPALALTLLSIGLTLRDGYFVVAGYVIAAGSVFLLMQVI